MVDAQISKINNNSPLERLFFQKTEMFSSFEFEKVR